MLQISGPGAQSQVDALSRLLDAAPALRPQVVAAEWIGNRRWNVTFKTGQVLALPQGDDQGAAALIEFARLDGVNRLIGGKVVAFDMRTPERIYMRCPECAENKPPVVEGGTT
jgi:cell division protein FtsQ